MDLYFPYLIVGGGIGGVSCAETIYSLDNSKEICIVTSGSTIKSIVNINRITKIVEDFDVKESCFDEINKTIKTLKIIQGVVNKIIEAEHKVILTDNSIIHYERLCICTGGSPKLIDNNNPYVVGIRDTESVENFKNKLENCQKIIIVGNGGIATELVYEISNCEISWLVKDDSISHHYLDQGAAQFLLNSLDKNDFPAGEDRGGANKTILQRHKYTIANKDACIDKHITNGALGPDWAQNLHMRGSQNKKQLKVVYKVEVTDIISENIDRKRLDELWNEENPNSSCPYKVCLILTNGSKEFGDLVVSATGVFPQYPCVEGRPFDVAIDDYAAINIGEDMRTNLPDIYAVGDCCHANWQISHHWFQMRLWSQARFMGMQAARSMVSSMNNEEYQLDFVFELFSHVTKFFGYSVIMLGLYNCQKMTSQQLTDADTELIMRVTPNQEYIKLVMVQGRCQGALLIGETEMAEVIQEWILSQMDLSEFGESLLDPDVDIVDYFD